MHRSRATNEGPKEIILPLLKLRTCEGCRWLDKQLLKSGRKPVYRYDCTHGDKAGTKDVWHSWLSGNLDPYYDGKLELVETPEWCPCKNKKP